MPELEHLVTNRTAGDVQRETEKGFYSAPDMNRVEEAAGCLASLLRALPESLTAYGKALGIDWARTRLGYDPASMALQIRTNWTIWDIPDAGDAQRYLSNVAAVCTALRTDLRDLPSSLDRLTYAGANSIEACLQRAGKAYDVLERQEMDRLDRTAQAWPMAGEIFAGEMIP